MLIEASKGGHTTVVNLLLDWPSQAVTPPADPLAGAPKSGAVGVPAAQPRVPNIGLPNIVPPQDPNAAHAARGACARTTTSANIKPATTEAPIGEQIHKQIMLYQRITRCNFKFV